MIWKIKKKRVPVQIFKMQVRILKWLLKMMHVNIKKIAFDTEIEKLIYDSKSIEKHFHKIHILWYFRNKINSWTVPKLESEIGKRVAIFTHSVYRNVRSSSIFMFVHCLYLKVNTNAFYYICCLYSLLSMCHLPTHQRRYVIPWV